MKVVKFGIKVLHHTITWVELNWIKFLDCQILENLLNFKLKYSFLTLLKSPQESKVTQFYGAINDFLYIFTTAFYVIDIFVDTITNNYQPIRSSNLLLYDAKGTISSIIFKLLKYDSYPKHSDQCKIRERILAVKRVGVVWVNPIKK